MSKESELVRGSVLAETYEANGYEITDSGKPVHREVYKRAYGEIPLNFVVHHIDENKKNNNATNLIAIPKKLHFLIHKFQHESKERLSREQLMFLLKFELVRMTLTIKGKKNKKKWKQLKRLNGLKAKRIHQWQGRNMSNGLQKQTVSPDPPKKPFAPGIILRKATPSSQEPSSQQHGSYP